jgi:adenosine deaminase
VMGISLMDEYQIAHKTLGMSIGELKRCNSWAAEVSFIPKEKKDLVWAK